MTFEFLNQLSALYIPQFYCSILTSTRQLLAVGGKCHTIHASCVLHFLNEPPASRIPQFHCLIITPTRQLSSVKGIRHSVYPIRVTLKSETFLAAFPDLDFIATIE